MNPPRGSQCLETEWDSEAKNTIIDPAAKLMAHSLQSLNIRLQPSPWTSLSITLLSIPFVCLFGFFLLCICLFYPDYRGWRCTVKQTGELEKRAVSGSGSSSARTFWSGPVFSDFVSIIPTDSRDEVVGIPDNMRSTHRPPFRYRKSHRVIRPVVVLQAHEFERIFYFFVYVSVFHFSDFRFQIFRLKFPRRQVTGDSGEDVLFLDSVYFLFDFMILRISWPYVI